MANNSALINYITSVIRSNGNQEITGDILQGVLLNIVNRLGYQFAGIATPTTVPPSSPDANIWYLASAAGTYTNFNGVTLDGNTLVAFLWDGDWSSYTLLISGTGGGGTSEVTAEWVTTQISNALFPYATKSWVTEQGYLTSFTSGDIIAALGYTPLPNTTNYALGDAVGGNAINANKLGGNLPSYYAAASVVSALATRVGTVEGNITTLNGRVVSIEEILSEWFEFDAENNILYLRKNGETARHFISYGDVIAGGFAEGEDPSTLTTIGELVNVSDDADTLYSVDKMLIKLANSTEWTLADLSSLIGLDETALLAYLTTNNYAKKSDIPTIPTALPNPNALTFGNNSYDGSVAMTITASDLGLGNVENTALSTWVGSGNITTLGTISSGVWNGSAIANAYVANLPISKITNLQTTIDGINTNVSGVSNRVTALEDIIGIDDDGNIYIKKDANGNARTFYNYGDIVAGGYAEGGSTDLSISYTPILETGTEIGIITINGVAQTIYAPEGGGSADSVEWSGILNKPSTLEGYGITASDSLLANYVTTSTLSSTLSGYLPLSGGTISSSELAPLNIKRDSTTGAAAIAYSGKSGTYGTLGFNDATGPKWFDMSYVEYTLIHSSNYSDYAYPKDGKGYLSFDTLGRPVMINNQGYAAKNTSGAVEEIIWLDTSNVVYVGGTSSKKVCLYDTAPVCLSGTLIHSGNIASQSVSYATSAGSADVISKSYANEDINYANNESKVRMIYATSNGPALGYPDTYYSGLSVLTGYTGWQMVTYGSIGLPNPYFRSFGDNGGRSEWRQLAFVTDNVASATKLQTARIIWGQSFDGTGDVSGDINLQASKLVWYSDVNNYSIGTSYTNASSAVNIDYVGYAGHRFICAYGEAMRITPTSNVLIGTTTDNDAKLQVNGRSYIGNSEVYKHTIVSAPNAQSSEVYALKVIQGSDCGSGLYDTMIITSSDVATLRLSESDGTQMGICAGDLHGTLTSTHDFRFFTGVATNQPVYSGGGGAFKVGINYGGAALYVSGAIIATSEITAGSDIRYKSIQNDVILDTRAIANAPIFDFKWIDREDDKLHLGTSAQYWLDYAPNAVTNGNDFYSLNYGVLGVAIGVSNAKKLLSHEEKLTLCENRIKQLENENKQLKEKLERYGIE